MAQSWTKQHFRLDITSRCPLKAAWCSAVRPALSDTFTLLSSGTRASAQRTALFAAAIWSGVCQFLSRAFTSAECLSNTWTASCEKSSHVGSSCIAFRFVKKQCSTVCYPESEQYSHTSLQEATARCRGVSHLLSLAFTLAPTSQRTLAVRLCMVIQLCDIKCNFATKIQVQFCNISICISTRTEQTA